MTRSRSNHSSSSAAADTWRDCVSDCNRRYEVAAPAVRTLHEQRSHEQRSHERCSDAADCGRLLADLHDGLGQELAVISLLLQADAKNPPRTHTALAREFGYLSRLLRQALRTLRQLTQGTVEFEKQKLPDALRQLARTLSRTTGLDVRFRSRVVRSCLFSASTAAHLYRIAQEAAANAVKHSRASEIVIELLATTDQIRLTIGDDGRGIGPLQAGGRGLQSMIDRAAAIGAALSLEPRAAGGTLVTCAYPTRSVRA